jgi:hypothetical protein
MSTAGNRCRQSTDLCEGLLCASSPPDLAVRPSRPLRHGTASRQRFMRRRVSRRIPCRREAVPRREAWCPSGGSAVGSHRIQVELALSIIATGFGVCRPGGLGAGRRHGGWADGVLSTDGSSYSRACRRRQRARQPETLWSDEWLGVACARVVPHCGARRCLLASLRAASSWMTIA